MGVLYREVYILISEVVKYTNVTFGTDESVLFTEVSSFQRLYFWTDESVLFTEVSLVPLYITSYILYMYSTYIPVCS